MADQGLGTQHGGKVGVKWSPHSSPKLTLPFPAETLAMVPESWPALAMVPESWPAWPEAWTRTSGPLVAPPAHPTPRWWCIQQTQGRSCLPPGQLWCSDSLQPMSQGDQSRDQSLPSLHLDMCPAQDWSVKSAAGLRDPSEHWVGDPLRGWPVPGEPSHSCFYRQGSLKPPLRFTKPAAASL